MAELIPALIDTKTPQITTVAPMIHGQFSYTQFSTTLTDVTEQALRGS
jgi:hypothetical protein